MKSQETEARDQLLKARILLERCWYHSWKGIIVGVLGITISIAIAALMLRHYISESTILYRAPINLAFGSNDESTTDHSSETIGERLKEILLSRPNLEAMIKEFNLYPEIVEARGYVEAADEMRKDVEFRIGAGDTFHVSYRGRSPQAAKTITEKLGTVLIDAEAKLRLQQSQSTVKFFEAQQQRVVEDLKRREQALALFLAKHPEFAQEASQNAGAGGKVGIAVQASNMAKRKGDASVMALQRQANRIKSQLGLAPTQSTSAPTVTDPQLEAAQQAAAEEVNEAQLELRRTEAQFTDKHPDVRAAKSRVEAALARLQRLKRAVSLTTVVQPTATTATADKDALKTELDSINKQIALRQSASSETKQPIKGVDADKIVALETEWSDLNRDVAEARSRFLQVEEKLFKATLSANSKANAKTESMKIIDPAFEPTRPSGIGRSIIALAGITVSMTVALLIVLGFALLDDRIYHRLDLQRVDISPVLVVVPKSALDTKHKSASQQATS